MAVSTGREHGSTCQPLQNNAKLIGNDLLILEKKWKSSCEPNVAAYMILIRSLCNAQKADIALEFYKKMYELLLTCLAGYGDIVGVQLVANDMIRHSQIHELLSLMILRHW
ncbi:hypothetical protein PVL29_026396 [Vitis rotundifolia]|uniref:Pentatricopeptide repeat-containing protein n=1 Tax=Vitis rotundifolia TaxID=103349 RepID=A0AA38YMB0_VITRO|nr:hypothetical protein PVL29_026396 [Vitis rotundifolia]